MNVWVKTRYWKSGHQWRWTVIDGTEIIDSGTEVTSAEAQQAARKCSLRYKAKLRAAHQAT